MVTTRGFLMSGRELDVDFGVRRVSDADARQVAQLDLLGVMERTGQTEQVTQQYKLLL